MPGKGLLRADLNGLTPEDRAIVEKAAQLDKDFAKSVGAIAAGYLTDITSIIVTHAAEAGALIDVEVRVKNISAETLAITVTGLVEGLASGTESPLYYSPDYIWIDPGSTGSFTTSFIMPSEDVRLWVVTWYWAETEFVQDLVVYTDIALIEVPAFRIQIVDIIAPASASAGDVVDVEVKVANFTSFLSFYVSVNCIYDDTVLNFSPEYIWMVPAYPLVTESFTASFIMPDKDFHGLVASWYWDETEWIRDDFGYIDIALVEVPPEEYYGTITKKQLTYDSTVGIIPVTAKVSQGTRGIVTVLGRNDMDTTQQMGIIWRVKDPDGYVVEHYSRWEEWPYTSAGAEHKFDGGRFDLDKPGVWTIELALYMNLDDPVIVADYMGTLCTVEAIEYAGTISKKQFKYDNVVANIPVAAEVSQGMNGIVTAWGRNDMAVQQQLGMRWEVRDPDGYVVEQYPGGVAINWEYGYTGPGDEQDFIGGRFDLNKLGGYTIFIELFMNPDDPVMVADYDGLLCTVVAVEYAGTITEVFINKSPEGFRIPIPTEVAADNNTFEVGVRYKNLSGRTVEDCGPKVEVWDPDDPGHVYAPRFSPSVDWTGMSHNEELETQYNIGRVDKQGDWTIRIQFLLDRTEVVDTYDGLLFTAVEEVLPPEYTLVQHTVYSYAYIYDGEVEVTTADFRISPFTSSAWAASQFAAELESEVKAAGARVIEVKAYADVSPFLWTDIRIEVTATPVTTTASKATGFVWAPVVAFVIKALAIIAVIVVLTLAVKSVLRIFQHKPINEEIKQAMTKETLVSLAVDLEVKLNLPPTPVDDLEGMTKGELAVYCDMLAEEIVPPGIEIPWAWIAIGGAAVLGVAALTMGRKR